MTFDLFHRDPCLPGVDDPYTTYAQLREQSSVHWCSGPRMWVILGYAEAVEQMRSKLYSRQLYLDSLIARFAEKSHIYQHQRLDIPFMDGDIHNNMRMHVSHAYRSIDLDKLFVFSKAFAAERLGSVDSRQPFDLVNILANDLPIAVVSELLGLPASQQKAVAHHVSSFVRARGLTQTDDTAVEGEEAFDVYSHYFMPLIQARRKQPKDDLISQLIGDSQAGIRLSDEQLLLIISSNFYSASLYTIRLLVGTLAWAMACNPDCYRRIRSDRKLIPNAIEETLRWDPPAQAVNGSVALEDHQINGTTIRAGEAVTVLVGAANRDPAIFDQPDHFCINRAHNPHLSFAPGIHQCLGLHMARLEARAVLEVLCDQFEQIQWVPEMSKRLIGDRFRGFECLVLQS